MNGGWLVGLVIKLCLTLVTPWTVACLGFSNQEYWSGLPFISPGDLPHPGFKPRSAALQAGPLPPELLWEHPMDCPTSLIHLHLSFSVISFYILLTSIYLKHYFNI